MLVGTRLASLRYSEEIRVPQGYYLPVLCWVTAYGTRAYFGASPRPYRTTSPSLAVKASVIAYSTFNRRRRCKDPDGICAK